MSRRFRDRERKGPVRRGAFLCVALVPVVVSLPGLSLAGQRRPQPPALPETAQSGTVPPGEPPQSGEPLHRQIDALIEASLAAAGLEPAGPAADAEFVRRVYLDLIGRVPSAEEIRAFLSSGPTGSGQSPEQARLQLIDRLLASPEYVRRMQYVLDEMIMERRGGSVVPDADWRAWLRRAVSDGRSWSWIAGEILSADGADQASRPPAKFYLDRGFAMQVVTRDVGRVFLGVDLECAQCHDHPSIDSYLQRHYYGINAFLSRSYVFTDAKSKKKMLGEKAEGEVKFTSVFTDEEGGTAPRLLDLAPVTDPDGTTGEYIAKPDKKTRGVPKYSRREQLARQMTAPENLDFRRNIANRVWALMIGRGLVEPLDVLHAGNPPSHPQLLDLLARQLLQHDDDLRWLIREIARSRTYQRSSTTVEGARAPAEPDGSGGSVAGTQLVEASLQPASAPADEDASSRSVVRESAAARLRPLSPEQLAWSVMQVLGVTDRTLAAKQVELAAKRAAAEKSQAAAAEKPDEADQEPRARATKDEQTQTPDGDDPVWQEQVLREALRKNVDQFVAQFAGQGGQKTGFDATASQALFLINGPLVQRWLEPVPGSLTERLLKIEDSQQLTEELFLAVLGRLPEADETAGFVSALNVEAAADRAQVVKDLTWALLASAEFRFNH